jgi:CheY-like chemotaxis protein
MNPTVFIIDDDPDQVALVTAQLERGRRFATKGFTRPDRALEEMRADPPDAVVCDLVMPGMDGLAFVRRLREFHRALPVIIATARGTEGDAERALEAGATDFVSKPIEPRAGDAHPPGAGAGAGEALLSRSRRPSSTRTPSSARTR